MGKFKKIVQFENEHMPEYQWNFLYRRCMPGMFFVIGGAIVAAILATIGSSINNDLLVFIPVGLYAVISLVLMILFIVNGRKVSKRLLFDKTRELEDFYTLFDLDTAAQNLASDGFIVNNELVLYPDEFRDDEHFEDYDLPPQKIKLEDCDIVFECKTWSGVFHFQLYFLSKDNHMLITYVNIDTNLYCYFAHQIDMIYNKELFRLFVDDKEGFLKLLYKYNDSKKMENHLKKLR